jgi:uridine kinase
MGVIAAQLWRNQGFRLGLAIRLLLVAFVVPHVQQIWFVPFMRHSIAAPGLDPWSSFLTGGGDPLSFPYGIPMYVYHLPFVAAGMLAEWLSGFHGLAQAGFALSLLTADFVLLLALCRMNKEHIGSLVLFYWLSPLALYITFWHGQTDVIPMLLIVSSLFLLRSRRPAEAGGVYALALAAKLSAVIPLPFILLYLWKNRRNRQALRRFAAAGALVSAVLLLPALISPGYRAMVFGSPEIARIYDIAINLSGGVSIYLVPTLYLLLLYWAWQIGRMNFEMLFAFLGVSFFLILLATPASVGWFLWVVPFLAVYQIVSGRGPRVLIGGFSLGFVLVKLLVATGAAIPILGLDFSAPLGHHIPPRLISLAMSGLTATGLVICITMIQRALQNNDFFRLSRRPLIVGIAGDSGSGKDTLSAALAGLFGDHSVASVSGDDYHRFERTSPMWQAVSHLDPRANDLGAFASDCLALVEGKHIQCRHYDHKTGRFTRRQRHSANDVVLASGLHALYPADLRARMDLRIFLAMDEDLRRFLKLRRDVVVRGHSEAKVRESIDRRLVDFERYVKPQAEHADVLFSLQPAAAERIADLGYDGPIPLRMKVSLRTVMRSDELVRVLTSLCRIQAEIMPASDRSAVEITIEGDEIDAADVQCVARLLVPHIDDLLDIEPRWLPGMTGVMQIVSLMLIAEQAKNRG